MKHIITALLLVASTAAAAHGSSHPPQTSSTSDSSRASFTALPRVLIFNSERNSAAADGSILVCPQPSRANGGECVDNNGNNAWQRVEWITPAGFKLDSYEYRFVGSGYRTLLVYFAPVTAAPAIVQKDDIKLVSPIFTGPVTINADKVTVQRVRRKH